MKSDISGFPEFLPNEQIAFNRMVKLIREHFELYGFVPLETAAVERVSTLLSKGNDKEIYGLYRLADENSKKDLGLRFDLTVPLARYVGANAGQLIFPYKRYQIAPVWRGERPQFGRFRQFYQCDFDAIGNGELCISHDAEIVSLLTETLLSLNIPNFLTKINNRKILCGFLKTVISENRVTDAVMLIDKMEKIALDEFCESMRALYVSDDNLDKIRSFLDGEKRGDNSDILRWLKPLNFNEEFNTGVAELGEVLQLLKKLGIDENFIKISLKLARGLNYYTGSVFETTLESMKDMGSIAGGGRYDNLSTTISDKKFPGVGATIGISRLITKLFEKNLIKHDVSSTAQVLVTVQNRRFLSSYMKIANKMRKIGISVETYLQDKNLGAQLSYASRKGFKFALIANEVELLDGKAIIRNLETKTQKVIRTEYMGEDVLSSLM